MSPHISLRFSNPSRLRIRELTGNDEQAVRETNTASAIGLLDRLVEDTGEQSWSTAKLTASDRDRMLAAVYYTAYGRQVEAKIDCRDCGKPLSLNFYLDDLMAALEPATDAAVERLPDGTFRTREGVHFRLPTGEDELAVAGLAPQGAEDMLFARCLIMAPLVSDARAAVERAIEDLSPIADLDLTTACPECEAEQAFGFDVQFYVLQSIERDRPRRLREFHQIACAYGWSLAEILSLRRSERRTLGELIESERPHRRGIQ
jgi:hypothetical protein